MSSVYTISSKDPEHYNRITTYFEYPGGPMAQMMVTSLTTNCYFRLSRFNDYIVVDDKKIINNWETTNMTRDDFIAKLKDLVKLYNANIDFALDGCKRLMFGPRDKSKRLVFNDASYNMRLLMGLHPFNSVEIIIEADTVDSVTIPTVGYMLSTPVLYLACNLGAKCYKNVQEADNIQSMRIVMRLTNSFSADYPINAFNGEFSVEVASNDLTNVEFRLVDANMVEVDLLTPMFLSVNINRVVDDKPKFMLGQAETLNWAERRKIKDNREKDAEMRNFEVLTNMNEQAGVIRGSDQN